MRLTVRSHWDETVLRFIIIFTLNKRREMRGYKLTNQQSINMLMDEIDKALTLPNNFDEIITPFVNKNVDIQNNKCSKQQSLYRSNN